MSIILESKATVTFHGSDGLVTSVIQAASECPSESSNHLSPSPFLHRSLARNTLHKRPQLMDPFQSSVEFDNDVGIRLVH
jgi:hypothetical protein